jgi:hypothetical protein
MDKSIQFTGEGVTSVSQPTVVSHINQLSAVLDNVMNAVETLPNDEELGEAVRDILKPYVIMRNIARQQLQTTTDASDVNG